MTHLAVVQNTLLKLNCVGVSGAAGLGGRFQGTLKWVTKLIEFEFLRSAEFKYYVECTEIQ
jgi:hypothetical protein